MRILSLLPSASEIVYALGCGDSLVGVSHECDYPEDAKTKPIVSTSSLSAKLRSSEIHSTVSQHHHSNHSLYAIDEQLLKQIDPDVILTQELCTVCAIPVAQVRDAARILAGPRCVVSLEPNNLHQILENITAVAEVTGRQMAAHQLVRGLENRIAHIRSATAMVVERPKVFSMEWMDPMMAGGHWIPEMVRIAGGTDGLGREGKSSTVIEWARVVAFTPQILVIMPCGYKIPRAVEEIDRLACLPGWYELPAVRDGRVYVVDSPAYFSRPGPRIVEGLEILAQIIQPRMFSRFIPEDSAVKLQWDNTRPLKTQRMSERFVPLV
jgi:iron complex transport system substrate-binding protein